MCLENNSNIFHRNLKKDYRILIMLVRIFFGNCLSDDHSISHLVRRVLLHYLGKQLNRTNKILHFCLMRYYYLIKMTHKNITLFRPTFLKKYVKRVLEASIRPFVCLSVCASLLEPHQNMQSRITKSLLWLTQKLFCFVTKFQAVG